MGVTTLFVTHDQAEAMILSDRVLVMNAGLIAQDGTPRQIYEEPRTRFVMDFLGQVDHVGARVALGPDGGYVALLDGLDGACVPLSKGGNWRDGGAAVLAFRSCDVQLRPGGADGLWPGVVLSAVYLGERVEYVVQVGAGRIRVSGPATEPLGKGAVVDLEIPLSAIRAWPAHHP